MADKTARRQKAALERMIHDDLYDLVAHQLTVTGVDQPTGEYILRKLLTTGYIIDDRPTDGYYTGSVSGKDRYGRPTHIYGMTEDGRKTISREVSYDRDLFGSYVIWYARSHQAPDALISLYASMLADVRTAELQNVKACTAPAIVRVEDPTQRAALLKAFEDKADGVPVLMLDDKPSAKGIGVQLINLSPAYLADRFAEEYARIRDEFLGKFGFLARVDKRERVQNGETDAALGYAHDSIYTAIDYVNAQTEAYGLPWRLEMGGTLDEYYTHALAETSAEPEGEQNDT